MIGSSDSCPSSSTGVCCVGSMVPSGGGRSASGARDRPTRSLRPAHTGCMGCAARQAAAGRAARHRLALRPGLRCPWCLTRAGRRPLDELLRARLFEPLGMTDTAFFASTGRLSPCYAASDAGLVPFDTATDSRWAIPPTFPDARGGLVLCGRTAARTARTGIPRRLRLGIRRAGGDSRARPVGAFGALRLGGGLGTVWYSWPDKHAAAVLLTQVLRPSAELITTFLNEAERSLAAP